MLHTGPHQPVTTVAHQAKTLGALFKQRARLSGAGTAIYDKGPTGWRATSWREFYTRAAKAAYGLRELGLKRGERVAILGPTGTAWAIYDMAAQLLGVVSLGIYPKQSVEQIRYLVDHSDARVVLVDEQHELEQLLAAVKDNADVIAIVPWTQALYQHNKDADTRIVPPTVLSQAILSDEDIDTIQQDITADDTAILIYTSGTTGPPKGAMISHANILSLLREQGQFLQLYEDDLSFNFLPMAHAAERVLGFYGRINCGIATAYASSIGKVLEELQETQPTLFGSVPRIFEKAYGSIHARVNNKNAIVQRIFALAVSVAKQAAPYRVRRTPMPLTLKLQHRVCDRLVYRKVRAAFGGRVRQFVTGAAPIAIDILQFFWGAGLDIYEVYGMTEATVITHANRPGHVRLGTVGKVVGGISQKIAHDGEVLVRGPFVFKGYYKNEAATAATIIDGWLHTGDIGTIDSDGYLRITDRKKHLIITAGGKNLAPANIENAIKNQSPLISQVHAHGDRRPYISALIAPSAIETLELGVRLGVISEGEQTQLSRELMNNPTARSPTLNQAMAKVVVREEMREQMSRAVAAGNRHLARVERVRRFVILNRDFSQSHGELTPTMKVKRKAIESKYHQLFDRIYNDDGFAQQPAE